MDKETIVGEYYLQGQMEMASGFLLKPDGSFQFFLSYGALDRHGLGQWEVKGKEVVFNSAPKPPFDFALVKSSAELNDLITIKIETGNPSMARHVFCSLEKGAEGSWKQIEQDGVQFPEQAVDSISLLFEFCPERFSTIPVDDREHNEFIFRFEPTITEVFLENFSLQVQPGELTGSHPLMEGNEFRYEKQ